MPGNVTINETAAGSGVYKFAVTGAKVGKLTGHMLSKSEMFSIVENVKKSCAFMQAHEKDWSALEKALKSFEEKAKQNTTESKDGISSMLSMVGGVKTFVSDYTKYNVLVMKNLLKYVELVLDNWGGKKAAAQAQA